MIGSQHLPIFCRSSKRFWEGHVRTVKQQSIDAVFSAAHAYPIAQQKTEDSKEFLRCRFCSWRILKWRRGKDGRNHSGWAALKDHIGYAHEAEAEKLWMHLKDECPMEENQE